MPSTGRLNNPTYRLLQSLPTDPRALLAMIVRPSAGTGRARPGDLHHPRRPAPLHDRSAQGRRRAVPGRRADPGVTVVSGATDAIGRPGVAVAWTAGGIRSELIFSTATLRLIGERTVAVRTGVTTDATAIIATGIADHLGQVP